MFFRIKQSWFFPLFPALVLLLLYVPVARAEGTETSAPAMRPNNENLVSAPVVSTALCSCPTTTERPKSDLFRLRPYKPLYIIAAYDRTLSNGDQAVQDGEAQFQLSFQIPLANIPWAYGKFAFGYTQVSFWQIFNGNYSAPFRETNYAPELMTTFDYQPEALGLKRIHTVYSLIHQSNGRGGGDSRSWNRVYAEVNLEWEHFSLGLKPWYRIPEQQKSSPSDARGDDNPDIHRYMGYGELTAGYKDKTWFLEKPWSLQLTVRNNFRGSQNHGATQIDFTYELMNDAKFYVQAFEGYGLSLIDYNRRSTRIGCGVLLARWP